MLSAFMRCVCACVHVCLECRCIGGCACMYVCEIMCAIICAHVYICVCMFVMIHACVWMCVQVHVWQLVDSINVATLHVVITKFGMSRGNDIILEIRKVLHKYQVCCICAHLADCSVVWV